MSQASEAYVLCNLTFCLLIFKPYKVLFTGLFMCQIVKVLKMLNFCIEESVQQMKDYIKLHCNLKTNNFSLDCISLISNTLQ